MAFAVFMLACAGLLIMYSSGFDHGTRFEDHGRNMLIAAAIMFVVAWLIERLALRHLVNQEGTTLLMATLGISYFLARRMRAVMWDSALIWECMFQRAPVQWNGVAIPRLRLLLRRASRKFRRVRWCSQPERVSADEMRAVCPVLGPLAFTPRAPCNRRCTFISSKSGRGL